MDWIRGLKGKISDGIGNFVAQEKFTINGRTFYEGALLTSGGYGYINMAIAEDTGERYVMKKMICQGKERQAVAENEINILKRLPKHVNLVQYFGGAFFQQGGHSVAVIILEFCEGGTLFDLMAKYEGSKLSEKQIIFIMKELAGGLHALHSLSPPIAHRDIKIENALLSNKHFKLCDFGSAESKIIDFKNVPKKEFDNYEEIFDKNTTLMYRPPEMADPYQLFRVDTKVDIWMLGCILYTLIFYKHPFMESSKLAIINAAYYLPDKFPCSDKLIDLVMHLLTPNPTHRPDVFEVKNILENWSDDSSFSLNTFAMDLKAKRISDGRKLNAVGTKGKNNGFGGGGDISAEELERIRQSILNEKNEVGSKSKKIGAPKIQNQPNQNFTSIPSKPLQNHEFNDFQSSEFNFDNFQQKPIEQKPLPPQNNSNFVVEWDNIPQTNNQVKNISEGGIWDFSYNANSIPNQKSQSQNQDPQFADLISNDETVIPKKVNLLNEIGF